MEGPRLEKEEEESRGEKKKRNPGGGGERRSLYTPQGKGSGKPSFPIWGIVCGFLLDSAGTLNCAFPI